MKILIACEFSGIVRDAFSARGHDAWSCDLLPSERPGNHIQGDVLGYLRGREWFYKTGKVMAGFGKNASEIQIEDSKLEKWDLLIAHPPCTHLAVSGARWFKEKQSEQQEALEFVQTLLDCQIPRIALENPVSIISSRIRKPDQIIQPWQFGHGETKATCLWLKNLPLLKPTAVVAGRVPRVHRASPGQDRWKERSRTYQGIANAMAEQWG